MGYLVQTYTRSPDGVSHYLLKSVPKKPPGGALQALKQIQHTCQGTLGGKILAARVYERVQAKVDRSFWSAWAYFFQKKINPYSNARQIEKIYRAIMDAELAEPRLVTKHAAADLFRRSVDPWLLLPKKSEVTLSRKTSASPIINGIYLGNDQGFAETTGLPCLRGLRTDNAHRFRTIISVCPTETALRKHLPFMYLLKNLSQKFEERKVNWINVGQNVWDIEEDWEGLIHNCTFPTADLSQERALTDDEHLTLLNKKKMIIKDIPVQDWFEPVFKILDRAFTEGERTLIHCQAGVSRSSTVLAAYFIKRLKVKPRQAIAFLRNRRLCVNSSFYECLKAYARLLKPTPLTLRKQPPSS